MQRAEHEDFLDRVELYMSQLAINSKIDFDKGRTKEEIKDHPYLMPKVYSVWICNFEVPWCDSYREEIGLFKFSDIGTKKPLPLYSKKRYLFVDLTKYIATGKSDTESEWLDVFTKMASTSKAPKTQDKVIGDVYSRMMVKGTQSELITEIAKIMVTQAEISTRIGTARREGREEGRKEGLENGRKQNEEQRRNLIARKLQKGETPEHIADFLEIPLSQVLEIQKELQKA